MRDIGDRCKGRRGLGELGTYSGGRWGGREMIVRGRMVRETV
jgi:hypothetical protein